MKRTTLASKGGEKVRRDPLPRRSVLEDSEYEALVEFLSGARESGKGVVYNGPKEEEFTRLFCEYMGGGYADAVCSGTNAVFVAIGALGIEPLSEIVVPPWTDPGGVMPVLFHACVPVMADARPGSWNTSAAEIEKVVTPRTKAVIVSHIAGEAVDMGPVMDLAKDAGLWVIEDCAQAFGAECRGRMVGTYGHIAAFSTMYTKHLATGGQGGLVYTRDERLFWETKRFADRGKAFNLPTADGSRPAPLDCDVNELGENVRAGLNSNSTEMACLMGIEQVKKLPGMIERRRAFGEELAARLERESRAVRIGWQPPDTRGSYWFLRFHFDAGRISASKEDFCRELRAEGIPVTTTWRKIPCEMPWFKEKRVFGDSGFPWTCSDYGGARDPAFKFENIDRAVEDCFTLPINENFGARELDDIVGAVLKVEAAFSG